MEICILQGLIWRHSFCWIHYQHFLQLHRNKQHFIQIKRYHWSCENTQKCIYHTATTAYMCEDQQSEWDEPAIQSFIEINHSLSQIWIWLRFHLLYSLWTITCSLFKSRLIRPLSNSSFHIISGFASRSNTLHFRIYCHPYITPQPIMLQHSDLVSFVCLMCLVCKASIQN